MFRLLIADSVIINNHVMAITSVMPSILLGNGLMSRVKSRFLHVYSMLLVQTAGIQQMYCNCIWQRNMPEAVQTTHDIKSACNTLFSHVCAYPCNN